MYDPLELYHDCRYKVSEEYLVFLIVIYDNVLNLGSIVIVCGGIRSLGVLGYG